MENSPSLAIVLLIDAIHPAWERFQTWLRQVPIPREKVYLYALDEGVRGLSPAAVAEWNRAGIKVFGCAYAAERRHLPLQSSVTYGGLALLHDLLATTESFICVDETFDEKDLAHHQQ
jgi:hypothetical protein